MIKFIGMFFVIAALVLGVTGIAWWVNSVGTMGTVSPGEMIIQEDDGRNTFAKTANPIVTPHPPTVAAPAPPTAISTSFPQPTPILLPTLVNPPNVIFLEEAEIWQAGFSSLSSENTGIWQYQSNSIIHPLALEINNDTAFLLDGGRVLEIDLRNPRTPQLLLAPGNEINGVQVLEPLDLAVTTDSLLVLDRAGDVYRYDLTDHTWQIDRYDRPVEASSGHYFVALDGTGSATEQDPASINPRALLETNYKFAMLYGDEKTPLWNLPEGRSIDLSVQGDDVYVLQREMHDSSGSILKYTDTRLIDSFKPRINIEQPRQVVATKSAVYILDQDGRRLRTVDPNNGTLLHLYQVPQSEPISTFAVSEVGQLILAARDRLYFFEQPERLENIPVDTPAAGIQPHDSMIPCLFR